MDNKAFILGGLVLLVLFGCVSQGGGAQTSSPQPSQPQQTAQQAVQPSQQVASGIGDADISVSQTLDEADVLTQAEPVEADNGTVATAPVVPATGAGISGLEGSVDVSQVNETDVLTDAEPLENG
jgi:hypothetical protein